MMSLMSIENFTPFVEGLDHPEGVTWGQDGKSARPRPRHTHNHLAPR